MQHNTDSRKKRRIIAAIVAVAAVAIVIFICIFSLYHLPERDPVETPVMDENPNYVESPASDFEETNDIMSASQQEVADMLGNLEMQYQNALVNDEPYAAQQAGMRLALGYWKAGKTDQAIEFTNSLIQNYSYDTDFVSKCQKLLKTFEADPS